MLDLEKTYPGPMETATSLPAILAVSSPYSTFFKGNSYLIPISSLLPLSLMDLAQHPALVMEMRPMDSITSNRKSLSSWMTELHPQTAWWDCYMRKQDIFVFVKPQISGSHCYSSLVFAPTNVIHVVLVHSLSILLEYTKMYLFISLFMTTSDIFSF